MPDSLATLRRMAGPACLLAGFAVFAVAGRAAGQTPDSPTTREVGTVAVPATEEGKRPVAVPRVPWLVGLSWSEVLQRAEASGRPILIDFTATWCGPCKLLDVMVFTEKAVISELAEVITFQVDIDRPEYRALKEELAIEVLPTVVWCDFRGREFDRFTGYVSSVQFLEIIRGWRRDWTIDRMLAERQGSAPQDPATLLDLARRQAERGNERQAEVIYRRLLNLRGGTDPVLAVRGVIGLAELEQRAGRMDSARRHVAGLMDDPAWATGGATSAADAKARTEALLQAALFQEAIGDNEGMLATYRRLAEREPGNVLVLHGYAKAALRAGEDLGGATRAALRAAVYHEDDPEILSTLAACYYQRRQFAKAVKWQEKAVAAAPDQPGYRTQLEQYREIGRTDPHGLHPPPPRISEINTRN